MIEGVGWSLWCGDWFVCLYFVDCYIGRGVGKGIWFVWWGGVGICFLECSEGDDFWGLVRRSILGL